MKLVLTKIESSNRQDYSMRVNKVNRIFIMFVGALVTSYSLEITEKIYLEN